ncbi:MAG: class I SAM-dependent methyltransferase [Candidatus Hatepunaea meridiana]|nr:class I SAM-dependent methyltransferase [Candidatus Hatepunaea meridiana]
MEYDPIKYNLATLLGRSALLRRLFFIALDVLFLRSWYIRRELRCLKSTINNRQSTILDAGMGFGQYSDRMLRMFKGVKLVGLEIDRKHLYGSEKYFRKVHPEARLTLGDVQMQPFGNQKFDLALTVDVMEHIEDDVAAFAEYYRVLKPGGYLLMHTPRIVGDESVGQTLLSDSSPINKDCRTGVSNLPENKDCRTGVSNLLDDTKWSVDEHFRDGYRDSEAIERIEATGLKVKKIIRGYGRTGHIAWVLLQRIPLSLLAKGKLWILPVAVYLLLILPLALLFMWLDFLRGDTLKGGSLLVLAQRPVDK